MRINNFLDSVLMRSDDEFNEQKERIRAYLTQESPETGLWEKLRLIDHLTGMLSAIPLVYSISHMSLPPVLASRLRMLQPLLYSLQERLLLLCRDNLMVHMGPIARCKMHGYDLVVLLKAIIECGFVETLRGGRMAEHELIRTVARLVSKDLSVSTIKNTRQYVIGHRKDPQAFFQRLSAWCCKWLDESVVQGRYERRGRQG